MPKEPISLSDAYRVINPGCVVAISAGDGDRDNLMALTWNTPVRKSPPLVAVVCGTRHCTYDLIERTGEFVINVMDARHLDALYTSGRVSGRDVEDKFGQVGLTRARGQLLRAPLVAEGVAHLECRVQQTVDLERSALLLGEVVAASADPAHFEDGMWTFSRGLRLIHHLSGDRFCVSEYHSSAQLTAELPN